MHQYNPSIGEGASSVYSYNPTQNSRFRVNDSRLKSQGQKSDVPHSMRSPSSHTHSQQNFYPPQESQYYYTGRSQHISSSHRNLSNRSHILNKDGADPFNQGQEYSTTPQSQRLSVEGRKSQHMQPLRTPQSNHFNEHRRHPAQIEVPNASRLQKPHHYYALTQGEAVVDHSRFTGYAMGRQLAETKYQISQKDEKDNKFKSQNGFTQWESKEQKQVETPKSCHVQEVVFIENQQTPLTASKSSQVSPELKDEKIVQQLSQSNKQTASREEATVFNYQFCNVCEQYVKIERVDEHSKVCFSIKSKNYRPQTLLHINIRIQKLQCLFFQQVKLLKDHKYADYCHLANDAIIDLILEDEPFTERDIKYKELLDAEEHMKSPPEGCEIPLSIFYKIKQALQSKIQYFADRRK